MSAEKDRQYFRYEAYKGNDISVKLPEQIEGCPLTVIGAKAFLSCRTVERLELPDTLEQVEDWGFAHMKNLRELVLPAKEIRFGKKVFLGCDSLERIFLRGALEQYEGIPFFLASKVRWMEGIPVELALAGDKQGQWKWLDLYDRALVDFLNKSDDTGFEPAFIGWFHVEDVDIQRQNYILERQKCKIRLVLGRLRYPESLSQDTRRQLREYLLGDGNDRAGGNDGFGKKSLETREIPELFLELCKEEFAQKVVCFRIWQQIGGFALYSP